MQRAAVIVPIVRYIEPAIVFVRRAAHLRRSPGDLGFPGGLVDAADGDDTLVTALREFEEELGVERARVRIIERLEDVETLALATRLSSFIGVIEPPVTWHPDPSETAGVHEVPLSALYAPGAVYEGLEPVERGGQSFLVRTWLFDHDDLHVWGASARILRGLLDWYPHLVDLPLTPPPQQEGGRTPA